MKKLLAIILSTLTVISAAFFSGCFLLESPKGPVYADYFVWDNNNHWRPLLDGEDGDPLRVDYAPHVNKKGKCECGFYFECTALVYGLNRYGTGLVCYGGADPDNPTLNPDDFNVSDFDNGGWHHVEIPAEAVYQGKTYPVVELYDGAFRYDQIKSVKLNEGLKRIGGQAFAYISELKEVVIPNSVNDVGGSIFYYNTGIEKVVIGDNVPAIYNYNFYYCRSLRNVTIGKKVAHIGIVAFNGCDVLEYVVLPLALKTMSQDGPSTASKYGPFSGCNLGCKIYFEHVSMPDGIPSEWNPSGLKTYFAGEWAYDDKGVPYPTVNK